MKRRFSRREARPLAARVLGRERAFRGRIIEVTVDRVLLPSGVEAVRETVRHPGAAAIVPVLPDGRILLVEQYRYAAGETLLEIPAGTRGAGESPLRCARRELREETGFTAARWRKLTSFLAAPGTLDEVITVFLARGLTPGRQALDGEEEGLVARAFRLEDALGAVRRGRVRDAKSIIGLLLASEVILGGRRPGRRSPAGAAAKTKTTRTRTRTRKSR